MEMVYAALLLHSLGKKIDETGVKKVMEAAGAKVDTAQIKALVSNLKGINIDEAIKQTTVTPAAPEKPKEEEKEKPEEEEKKVEEKAEEAAAGLGALFG